MQVNSLFKTRLITATGALLAGGAHVAPAMKPGRTTLGGRYVKVLLK